MQVELPWHGLELQPKCRLTKYGKRKMDFFFHALRMLDCKMQKVVLVSNSTDLYQN